MECFEIVSGRKDYIGKKVKLVEELGYGMLKVRDWNDTVFKVHRDDVRPTVPFRTRREITSGLSDPIAVPENDAQ